MKNKKILNVIILLVATMCISLFLTACGESSETEESTSNLKNGMNVTLSAKLPACTTKDNLTKLDNAMAQKNTDLQNSMLNSREVIIIGINEKIDILDLGAFTTRIQYKSSEYYVHTNMIED